MQETNLVQTVEYCAKTARELEVTWGIALYWASVPKWSRTPAQQDWFSAPGQCFCSATSQQSGCTACQTQLRYLWTMFHNVHFQQGQSKVSVKCVMLTYVCLLLSANWNTSKATDESYNQRKTDLSQLHCFFPSVAFKDYHLYCKYSIALSEDILLPWLLKTKQIIRIHMIARIRWENASLIRPLLTPKQNRKMFHRHNVFDWNLHLFKCSSEE